MTNSQRLFNSGDLRNYLSRRAQSMADEIERYERNRFLNTPVEALVEYFVTMYQCDVPHIHEDGLRVDEAETKVDVSQYRDRSIRDRSRPFWRPGTRISLLLPFDGEADLLNYTPSTRFMDGGVSAHISDGHIVMNYVTDMPDEQALKRWKEEVLSTLRQYVAWGAADVENWNHALPREARQAIDARRDRLLRSQGLAASLGLPLATRSDAPRTYAVSRIVKRPMTPPPSSSTPYRPEPALAEEQFTQILSLLRPVGATIERDPGAFSTLNEESLRSLFLATLNSHFRGQATGETFNAQGKTDILIREGDRNIFIAECKIWRGPKSFADALDQLLSYATWRDAKLALLIFVRQKGFTEVVAQIPGLLQQHVAYRRALKEHPDAEWECTVSSQADPSRERRLAVLAFHCPV